MKKIISVLITVIMLFSVSVCALAVQNTANFKVNVISETDGKLKISVDYEGWAEFCCCDFDLEYNSGLLKAETAYDGDGMVAFAKYAKANNGATISSSNPSSNPVKVTFATTIPFKAVNGKDMFIVEFTKLSKQSVKSGDLKLVFTNCQTGDYDDVKTSVSYGFGSADTAERTTASQTAANNTSAATVESNSGKSVSTADDSEKSAETLKTGSETVLSSENKNDVNITSEGSKPDSVDYGKNTDADNGKKIAIVAAAAVLMLVVIVSVCVVLVKKTKKDDNSGND